MSLNASFQWSVLHCASVNSALEVHSVHWCLRFVPAWTQQTHKHKPWQTVYCQSKKKQTGQSIHPINTSSQNKSNFPHSWCRFLSCEGDIMYKVLCFFDCACTQLHSMPTGSRTFMLKRSVLLKQRSGKSHFDVSGLFMKPVFIQTSFTSAGLDSEGSTRQHRWVTNDFKHFLQKYSVVWCIENMAVKYGKM